MSPESLANLTCPIAKYYWSISPAISTALPSYLPTSSAVLFSVVSITMSLPTFCISFSFFHRKWRRLFAHPQRFIRGTSGRFLHIVGDSRLTASDTCFLCLSVIEFLALQALAKGSLHSLNLNTPLTAPGTINITTDAFNNLPAHSSVFTVVPNLRNRV